MAESYLKDQNRVLPCAVLLHDAYGATNLHVGVSFVTDVGGIERIVEISTSVEEKAAFDRACAALRELVEAAKKLLG